MPSVDPSVADRLTGIHVNKVYLGLHQNTSLTLGDVLAIELAEDMVRS